MDLNLIVLGGRLAAPPELRSFESGASLLRLLVTVRSTQPRRRVDVVPVTLWDPPQDLLDDDLDGHHRVWVVGSVQRRFWVGPEGRRSRLEVVAHEIKFTLDEPADGSCVDDDAIASGVSAG